MHKPLDAIIVGAGFQAFTSCIACVTNLDLEPILEAGGYWWYLHWKGIPAREVTLRATYLLFQS